MLKIFLFVCFTVLFCPLLYAQKHSKILAGAAQYGQYLPLLKDKRVGIVVNQTSMVGDSSLPDVLMNRKVKISTIFAPEHGYKGKADAGKAIENTQDSATQVPIISLYGKHKKPTAEYTYISTLQYCMEACAANNKPIIVLDRPNPNGFYVAGQVLDTALRSFVGMQPIPIVYGMTIGEYAKMLVGEKWFEGADKCQLTVIKCTGYTHRSRYELPVAPSPNLKQTLAIYAYPSLCLFEGTVVSVGRGTDSPFLQYGCPTYKGAYNDSFMPKSNNGAEHPLYENQICYGQKIGRDKALQQKLYKGYFSIEWLIDAYNKYEPKDKFFNPFIYSLCGSKEMINQIKAGVSQKEIEAAQKPAIERFKKVRKKYLLYQDF
ncbi:MAG: DUF1343 domain-containing protein [Chitinophagia bacterium]|nr:DUF1343 domain-containing protein [Chitinophagia bacterium]